MSTIKLFTVSSIKVKTLKIQKTSVHYIIYTADQYAVFVKQSTVSG